MNVFFEIHQGNLREGPGSFESTKKALAYLTKLKSIPQILDVGCGPGQQTIDLANLTNGYITSVDNYQPYLNELNEKIIQQGLEQRIKIFNKNMLSLDFGLESFDLIWSEGAIYNVGFENGLRLWRPLLTKNVYLAVTEISWFKENPPQELIKFWKNAYIEMGTINENISIIRECGYKLINHFSLPESDWWNYYNPIIDKLELLKQKYNN